MAPIALAFLALACAIFGTTSDSSHVHVPDELFEEAHGINPKNIYSIVPRMRQYNINDRSKRETNNDPNCLPFTFSPEKRQLTNPKNMAAEEHATYTRNTTCFTTIEAPDTSQVIVLTFLDVFEIEGHPNCENDYLEIRDGRYGYATPMYKFCGSDFPPTVTSTGPFLWLKFKSDDAIEYAGFTIDIDFPVKNSKKIPESCYISIKDKISGWIDSNNEDVKSCRDHTTSGPLDIQWKIETAADTQIYLNITMFQLANPNNCDLNTVQVFGVEPNFDHVLGAYCSSVAESKVTDNKGSSASNIMYVRMFTARRTSNFSAEFTAFRTAENCDKHNEFDCMDGTCIDISLKCNGRCNCRLKADEDQNECKGEAQSLMKDSRTIMIVFSLILSAILMVLVFKCVRKLYYDQKQINEYRANLRELIGVENMASYLSLNPRPPSPGATGLEENRANELCRQKARQKSSSSESDFLQIPVEDWLENVPITSEDIRIEPKGRPARDFSQKEELLREKSKEETENRDVSVGAPDLQEVECQTRESLFLTEPVLKIDETRPRSISRSESSARPAPPPRQHTTQDVSRPQTERPMSSETTRSAPDVIIVSPRG